MIRNKFVMFGAAIALLGSSLGVVANSATATTPPTDVSQHHVVCTTMYGTVGFKPNLTATGTATSDAISVKGVIDGCVDSDNAGVLFAPSSFSGKLTGPSDNFGSLLGASAITGSIKVSWKLQKASLKITPTSTVLSPTTASGGLEPPVAGLASTYASFTLSGGGATGAFVGTDAGASSGAFAVTSQDLAAFTSAVSGAGIKSINLGLGQIAVG